MNEFRFNCPKCGQHILANAAWIGRRIDCPSCNTRIVIPRPAKPPEKKAPRVAPASAGERPLSTENLLPAAPAKTEGADTEKPATSTSESKRNGPPEIPKPLTKARVALLTPAVKLDIVRAVRSRIAKESSWLPGQVEGATAYAAKMREGKLVLVETKNPEASRFSLLGAFLVEMHARQVIRTATGRKKFLDDEIPDAIREVLLDEMNDEEREAAEDAPAEQGQLTISHAQCLVVLDELERRYSHRMDQLRIEKAKKRLGNVRLADLVQKLEKKARILPEDVATALYHELAEMRRRLDRLESKIGEGG